MPKSILRWLIKHKQLIKYILAFVIAWAIVMTLTDLAYIADKPIKWIRAQYGIKCNAEGQEHGNTNIEQALYYNSIEECENSLKN